MPKVGVDKRQIVDAELSVFPYLWLELRCLLVKPKT